MPPTSSPRTTAPELSPHERAFYGEEARLLSPASYEELIDVVREAEAAKAPIIPAGRGAHAYLGHPPPRGARVLSMRSLDRVLRYEPGDFTIGVHAGLPLAALRERLVAHGQEVPLDWPRGAAGTVGGLVATAPPGLRRARWGPVRGLVIGIVALRSGGRLYKAGGMVVKNVAGYEVMKLLTGSLGTAGIILEVNFKLKPLPARQLGRLASFADRAAAWRFARAVRARRLEPATLWILEGPVALEAGRGVLPAAVAPGGAVTAWILEGNAGAVGWQEEQIDALLAEAEPTGSAALSGQELDRLTELLASFPEPGSQPVAGLGIARLAALPSELEGFVVEASERIRPDVAALSTAADAQCGLATLRWESAPEAVAAPVAALAALVSTGERDGTLLYLPPAGRDRHPYALRPLPHGAISRRLLDVFGPDSLFAPGRLLGHSTP